MNAVRQTITELNMCFLMDMTQADEQQRSSFQPTFWMHTVADESYLRTHTEADCKSKTGREMEADLQPAGKNEDEVPWGRRRRKPYSSGIIFILVSDD